MKRTLSLILLILIAAVCSAQLALNGVFYGPVLDYLTTHVGGQTGDTQFSMQSANTFADGSSAGTALIDRCDGNGQVSLPGRIYQVWNDGTAPGGVGRSVGLNYYSILDLCNATNTTLVLANSMSNYGSSGAPNAPAGWNGKASSLDFVRNGSNWKTNAQPLSFFGWTCINPIRQGVAAFYESADASMDCSPDGGAHFCNPYTYFNHVTAPGCDVTNWQVNGDPPLCGSLAFSSACLDTAYNDGTHSSMMWKDQAPYNGTTNRMGRQFWFDYCQANACTGMPDAADTYFYGYSLTGLYGQAILFRVAKSGGIAYIMDPAHYEFYSQSSYSNTNVGDGTSWTSTLASAANIFVAAQSAGNGSAVVASGYTQVFGMWNFPVYMCANSRCGYIMTTSIPTLGNTGNQTQVVSFPAPWGPFTVMSQFKQPATVYQEFPQFIRSSAYVPDSQPGHFVITNAYDNQSLSVEKSLFWQKNDVTIGIGQVGAQPRGQSGLKFTYAPTAGTMISRGIVNYFDMWDHKGLTEWPTIGSVDVSHQPTSLASLQLIGCYFDATTSCGIPRSSKGMYLSTKGWSIEDGPGFFPYAEVRDLQLNAGTGPNRYNAVTDTTFSSNGNYTIDMVAMTTDITANQGFFNAGPVTQQLYIYNFSGAAGAISISFQPSVGVFIGTAAPNGTLVNNTWFHATFIHTATTHLCRVYINGIDVSVPPLIPAGGTPNVGAGSVYVGRTSAGAGNSMQGQMASVGWWNRVLDSSEVMHNHKVIKALMAKRGITLP